MSENSQTTTATSQSLQVHAHWIPDGLLGKRVLGLLKFNNNEVIFF